MIRNDDASIEEQDKVPEVTLLSELALARDWDLPEEEKAWAHLQDLISF
jgi:hypothetical protein